VSQTDCRVDCTVQCFYPYPVSGDAVSLFILVGRRRIDSGVQEEEEELKTSKGKNTYPQYFLLVCNSVAIQVVGD